MDNGCPECEKLAIEKYGNHIVPFHLTGLCLDCQLEQADADVLKAMNRYKELKKKKEKQNAKCR